MRQFVSEVDVNKTVPVELIRGGKPLTVNVQIGEKPSPAQLARLQQRRGLQQQPTLPSEPPVAAPLGAMTMKTVGGGKTGRLGGVQVAELSGPLARHLRLPGGLQGVVVARVDGDSPAADKLQAGDVIEQVNQQPVTTLADYRKVVSSFPQGGTVALSILRDRARMLVIIAAN